jgi:methylthioribose-1-phosphate isomerase
VTSDSRITPKTRPIWLDQESGTVKVIDQRKLPHQWIIADLETVDDAISAIQNMFVRGAPLIGVTGAWGVYLAVRNTRSQQTFIDECNRLKLARPTAVNLVWAVDKVLVDVLSAGDTAARLEAARRGAEDLAELEAENCRMIGVHGLRLIEKLAAHKGGKAVNILTHCNAGWLACVEYGTATAPMYAAHEGGIPIHVWVDETRPLNQGARLTAWELGEAGIPHTVITDNAGGHLMQHGLVDLVIVGTDRSTHTGDVANKIGTYLKALAARDNQVPFYVALPSSTFDWRMRDGVNEIPIETRDPDEVHYIQGLAEGKLCQVRITPAESPAANYAFDVTPARLVTGFITERGICAANEAAIRGLFPDK